MDELILGILAKDRPEKLSLNEQQREMIAREGNSLKIVVSGMKSQCIIWQLSFIVPTVVGRQIDFELAGFYRRPGYKKVDVVLKVQAEEEKWILFRHSDQFKARGINFYSYQTEREKHLVRWLKSREKELEDNGIRSRVIYQGMFIDGCKWVWDDHEGLMIKTTVRENNQW